MIYLNFNIIISNTLKHPVLIGINNSILFLLRKDNNNLYTVCQIKFLFLLLLKYYDYMLIVTYVHFWFLLYTFFNLEKKHTCAVRNFIIITLYIDN